MMHMKVGKCPEAKLTYTGKVYLHSRDFHQLLGADADVASMNICVRDASGVEHAFTAAKDDRMAPGEVGMNQLHRTAASVQWMVDNPVDVSKIQQTQLATNVTLVAERLGNTKKGASARPLSGQELTDQFGKVFAGQMVFVGAQFPLKAAGAVLKVTVRDFGVLDLGEDTSGQAQVVNSNFAQLDAKSNVVWETGESVAISGKSLQSTLFDTSFDFGKLGIGGLGAEFNLIFRRAFAPRCFNASVIKQLGIKHIRGMLLFGPPGCGKTLIARKIGQVLNAREPQIINGPEILNKYVGASEEAIREKFGPAEEEQREKGDDSELHIIIFDEIDAICKQRGSTNDGTGVGDSIVNQLLSKLDGVESLNNILVIGMTNRKDLIDDALLRPGRLELHVEIGLPDRAGRFQILMIHTKSMRESGRMTNDAAAYLTELSENTKNYSGAELEGLIRAAAQYALRRGLQTDDDGSKRQINMDMVVVERQDLEQAFQNDIRPAFGNDETEMSTYFPNGIIDYGPTFQALETAVQSAIEQVKTSARSPITSMLLYGPPKSGKTALMAKLAKDSEIPFVRMVSADAMVGRGEMARVERIAKSFKDSYRSPISMICLDDIERLLDYVRIGPRFSNNALQTFLILLKKLPPNNHRLLVVATTSSLPDLDALGLADMFDLRREVPHLSQPAEVSAVLNGLPDLEIAQGESVESIAQQMAGPIGVKQLLTVVERARVLDSNGRLTASGFSDALLDAVQI
uniref:Vesicle-fusing ATPase n=1 Tax=Pinguiococcus pyrenoidosus TaxID=172671 RepID=A0A7R9UH08_9STRA|mmetsp:Transcript_8834/g.33363  ORF Transcript_8834/g.33363 Transcript_8834/m.33363 type:complete len:744 (+) Transcript_8834:107-2338(+)|eukprot:scaffold470_cov257-Pinguiococcus_pyrenoidosus.AAC.26